MPLVSDAQAERPTAGSAPALASGSGGTLSSLRQPNLARTSSMIRINYLISAYRYACLSGSMPASHLPGACEVARKWNAAAKERQ
jgi:hypothetical protein